MAKLPCPQYHSTPFFFTLSHKRQLLSQNNPDATGFYNTSVIGNDTTPAITRNRSVPLSFPGREVYLSWENPGVQVGYNNSFTTNTTAGPGKVSQKVSMCFLVAHVFDFYSSLPGFRN